MEHGGSGRLHPEGAVRVLERGPGPLLLERRHLLPRGQVFHHKLGSVPTQRPERPGAKLDEEDDNAKHSSGVCSSLAAIAGGRSALCPRRERRVSL